MAGSPLGAAADAVQATMQAPAVEAPPAPAVEAPPAPAVEAPPAPPARGPAPWDTAVSERFADATVAEQVSAFMAEHTQPYVTKLEQEKADLAERAAWYDDLVSDPTETLRDAIAELYDDATAERVIATLTPQEQAEIVAAAAPPAAAPAAELSAADKAALEFARQQQQAAQEAAEMAEYEALLKPILAANPDINENAFHRYVAGLDPDAGHTLEDAVAAYHADFPAPAAPPVPPAPPVLGGTTSSGAPMAGSHGSLAAAAASVFDAAAKGRSN